MSIFGFANVRKVEFTNLARGTVPSIPIANKEMIVMFLHFSIIVLLSNI